VSVDTLAHYELHWTDDAKITRNYDPFEEFDRILNDLEVDVSLSVRQDAETWYVMNDIDVTFPGDPAPSLGLDTWDF
jgi:hypothetical protein